MSQNGKGDRQRPLGIPKEKFDNNWDEIFKNKEDTKPQEPPPIDLHDLEGRN